MVLLIVRRTATTGNLVIDVCRGAHSCHRSHHKAEHSFSYRIPKQISVKCDSFSRQPFIFIVKVCSLRAELRVSAVAQQQGHHYAFQGRIRRNQFGSSETLNLILCVSSSQSTRRRITFGERAVAQQCGTLRGRLDAVLWLPACLEMSLVPTISQVDLIPG